MVLKLSQQDLKKYLSDYTIQQLRKLTRDYNVSSKISKYSALSKEDLAQELTNHIEGGIQGKFLKMKNKDNEIKQKFTGNPLYLLPEEEEKQIKSFLLSKKDIMSELRKKQIPKNDLEKKLADIKKFAKELLEGVRYKKTFETLKNRIENYVMKEPKTPKTPKPKPTPKPKEPTPKPTPKPTEPTDKKAEIKKYKDSVKKLTQEYAILLINSKKDRNDKDKMKANKEEFNKLLLRKTTIETLSEVLKTILKKKDNKEFFKKIDSDIKGFRSIEKKINKYLSYALKPEPEPDKPDEEPEIDPNVNPIYNPKPQSRAKKLDKSIIKLEPESEENISKIFVSTSVGQNKIVNWICSPNYFSFELLLLYILKKHSNDCIIYNERNVMSALCYNTSNFNITDIYIGNTAVKLSYPTHKFESDKPKIKEELERGEPPYYYSYGNVYTSTMDKRENTKAEKFEYYRKVANCWKKGKSVVAGLTQKHHSNLLFFNAVNKTIERFEPHGSDTGFGNLKTKAKINGTIEKDLKLKGNPLMKAYPEAKFVPSTEVCPNPKIIKQYYTRVQGFQSYEGGEKEPSSKDKRKIKLSNGKEITIDFEDGGGFCCAWSLFYADLRLTFPKKTPMELYTKMISLMKTQKNTFRKFIRNFIEEQYNNDKDFSNECADRYTDLDFYVKKILKKLRKINMSYESIYIFDIKDQKLIEKSFMGLFNKFKDACLNNLKQGALKKSEMEQYKQFWNKQETLLQGYVDLFGYSEEDIKKFQNQTGSENYKEKNLDKKDTLYKMLSRFIFSFEFLIKGYEKITDERLPFKNNPDWDFSVLSKFIIENSIYDINYGKIKSDGERELGIDYTQKEFIKRMVCNTLTIDLLNSSGNLEDNKNE